ncbi:hypothetical protein PG995_010840 [Apiospora arundinis]
MAHQDVLNLGPLTTIFTAPLSCSQSALFMRDEFDCAGSTSILRGPMDTAPAAHCFPPLFDARPGAYYSPGICPNGYTAACTSINTQAAETILTCCPEAGQGLSYRCSLGSEWSWGLCHAALGGGATATLTDLKTVKCGSSLAGTESFLWDGVAQAQSIQVRFRREDVSLFNTSRQTTTTAPNGAITAMGSTGAAGSAPVQETGSSATSDPTANSSQLTSTTIAIIGVACGAIVLLIMAIAAWLFVRTRKISKRLGQSQQQLATLQAQAGPPKPEPGGGDDEDQLLTPTTATSPQDTLHASWQILRPPQEVPITPMTPGQTLPALPTTAAAQQPAWELMDQKPFEMDATPTLPRNFSYHHSLQPQQQQSPPPGYVVPDSPTVDKTSPIDSLGISPTSEIPDGIVTMISQPQSILIPDYKDPAFGDPATESRWSG